jgi:hypothetical protein
LIVHVRLCMSLLIGAIERSGMNVVQCDALWLALPRTGELRAFRAIGNK